MDFFTQDELNLDQLRRFSAKVQRLIKMDKIEFQHGLGLYTFFFYPAREVSKYKIDFGQYPFGTIKPLKKIRGLKLEDLYDLAVDKAHTISVRPRSRDFIDLYFILKQKKDWNLRELMTQAFEKFELRVDPLQMSENILRVEKLEDMPIMLKSINIKAMRQFYLNEIKKIKQEIFL